jgi:AcrR family transcriptional regulator
MSSQAGIGLRDLKKQITRRSIANAALELTVERGLEHVTLDEIARRAFVSPRTVSNYFSGKEEAIAAAGRDLEESILDDLAGRPDTEPPLESLHRITVDFVRSLTREELEAQRHKRLLGERHPGINAYLIARYGSVEETLRPALASRIGTDAERDSYPWVVAAAAVAAVRIAVTRWVRSDADVEELVRMLNASFGHLHDGLRSPQPTAVESKPDTRRKRRPALTDPLGGPG